ncbi:MAG: hypothetical protein HY835_11495, partial [Anaerolineae bacterium]|nr:hypothetical protein [Anaerolineae bacterium]
MLTRHWFFVISLVLTLLASACGEAGFGVAQAGLSAPASVPIDPVFKEFYQTLGGEALLGRGISTLVDRNGDQCQFVEAALMCFDQSEAESSKRYRLEPLGYQLQVSDDPRLPPPPDAGTRVLGDGFVLYREFETVYDRIYGDLYAGLPLTQVRINRDAQRYEQFFENVGFYRRFSDPPDAVHLLPYGGYFCGLGCSNHQGDFWQIVRSGQISQPFEMTLLRMGWNDLGRPVSQPRQPGDGTIEQVYESAVLYAPLDNISQIRMRPLVLWMGQVVVQPPVERNPHEQLVFYETENGLGY